jgi:hypothetical protein
MPDDEPIQTHAYPHKCLACGLHFLALSWSPTWRLDHAAYCPECGHQPAFSFPPEVWPRPIGSYVHDSIPADVLAAWADQDRGPSR